MQRGGLSFLIILFLFPLWAFATNRVSTGTGAWNTPGTWSPSGAPVAGDNLTILSGHTITMNGNAGACTNLTVNGTANWTSALTTNLGGNLIINNGGILSGSAIGILNVAGTFNVPVGSMATLGGISIKVNGASTVDGTLSLNNVNGVKTFAAVTVNSGGAWSATVNAAVSINGNVITASTFNCNSGTYTVSGNFSVNAGTTNFEGSIGGTLTVAAGSVFNANTGNCSVTGASVVSGTINITTTTGNKNFGDITVNAGGIWNSTVAENVTVTGNVISNGTFECFSGTYTVSGNFSVNVGTTNFEGSIGGNLTLSPGATFDGTTGVLTVSGSTSISGTLIISTLTSGKSFADVTVNSGGVWNCTVAESITITGNVTNQGTFTSNTGIYTLSGSGKILSGTLSISNAAITGAYTNNGTLTVGTALSGAGTLTQGTGSTLNIGGTSSITNLTATVIPNTVNYNGSANQTIKATLYHDLLVSSTGGTVTFGASTVNNNFTVATGTVSIGGVTMSVGGVTSVSGTLNVTSATGTKTFNDLTINSGGKWNSTVAESFTINGNLSNNGTFTANTGTYTLAGIAKTIAGTLSIPALSVTGAYTNNADLSSTASLAGVGTFSQGSGATLNMGASVFTVTTFNASALSNTVNYNRAAAQNVRIPSDGAYYHLGIAGSGIKTLAGTTVINGTLIISSTLDVSASNFAINLGGNWNNTGTFTPRNGTVTLTGAGAQSIAKPGGEIFNTLALSGSGIKTLGSAVTTNGNLTINSALDISSSGYGVTVKGNWINNGTFVQRSGTVTFNGGSAQTLGGSSTTDFNNITQSNLLGLSLAHAQNLVGVLTVSAGTFNTAGFNFTLISNASGTASIAAIPAGANFAGNIRMQRYTGTGPTDWRFLASPVSGGTIADWADDFATSGFPGSTDPGNSFVSVYSYNETATGIKDNGYVAATDVSNLVSNGNGYWVYLGPNPVTYSVSGPPHTFTVTPTVTFTSSAGANEDGWNLIANPYPSAIDWEDPNWTKTNIDNAVYVYNSSTGSYASYVAGVGVNGGSRYIASQQAFWVKANAASPAIKLVEKVKAAQNPSLLKQDPVRNVSHCPMAFKDFQVPLNANAFSNSITLTVNGNGLEDETFIQFVPGASGNFDSGLDAWKLQNLNPESPTLSSVLNDSLDLSINRYPSLDSNVTIPIRMRGHYKASYSIRRDSTLMLPMSSCVFLEDLENGKNIDLRSNISYSFSLSDTTSARRFLLHISAPVSLHALNTHCLNDSSGRIIAKGAGTGPWNYVWKNSAGNILKTTNYSVRADTLFNLSVGVYRVEVSGAACGIVSDTIRIKSSSSMVLASASSNVSCQGGSDAAVSVNATGGNAPYRYAWSSGATSSAINHLLAGNYSVIVTDAGGCTQVESFFISQSSPLVAGFNASTDTVDLSVSNSVTFTNMSSGASAYYWDFGDMSLPDTVSDPVHYYSSAGTYSVSLIVANGTCSDTTAYTRIVVMDSLVATQIPTLNFSSSMNVIYENGEVFLAFDLPGETDMGITVYNVVGEKIITQNARQVKRDRIKLNMDNFGSGIYVCVMDMRAAGQAPGYSGEAIIVRKIFLPSR